MRTSNRLLAAAAAAALAAGCGRGAKVVPVEGVVRYRGQPLPGGTVVFQPVDPDAGVRPAIGAIDPDGRYRLSTYLPHDGAIAGQYRVVVASYCPPPAKDPFVAPELAIPERYTQADKSGLTVSIPGDAKKVDYPIELKD